MKSKISTLVIVFALLIPFVFGADVDNELAEYEKAKKTLADKVDAIAKKNKPKRDVLEIYDVSSFISKSNGSAEGAFVVLARPSIIKPSNP
jgi:hypothetical protein